MNNLMILPNYLQSHIWVPENSLFLKPLLMILAPYVRIRQIASLVSEPVMHALIINLSILLVHSSMHQRHSSTLSLTYI